MNIVKKHQTTIAVVIIALAVAFIATGTPMMLIPLALASAFKSLWLRVLGILLTVAYVSLSALPTLLSTVLTVPFLFDFERKEFIKSQCEMFADGAYGAWTVFGWADDYE